MQKSLEVRGERAGDDSWSALAPNLVWALVALDLGGVGVALWLEVIGGASSEFQAQYGSAILNLVFGATQFLGLGFGALIAIRRPRHPVGWLLLLSASAFLLDQALTTYSVYAIHVTHRSLAGGDLIATFGQMDWLAGIVPIAIFLPLVFPNGRLLSRRWRPVVWIALVASGAAVIGGTMNSHQDPANLPAGVHPVVMPDPIAHIADLLGFAIAVLPLAVITAMASLVLRYRRGNDEERHQIKWLLLAVSVYGLGFGTSLILGGLLGQSVPVLDSVGVFGLALIPVSVAIAVLKYRLYDVDIVISRTLVYGALAAFITAVYVGIVVGVGTLVGSGGQHNLVLSIVATAIVAVAFQPVRERLQKIANRVVYGKRATPYEVLSRFSERVAETYAADETLPRMARVLAEGTGSEQAVVWLRSGDSLRPAATWPDPSSDGTSRAVIERPVAIGGHELPALPGDRSVAVSHQGEILGALTVSKRTGDSLTPVEEKLLEDLAAQAGLVLKNVGLTAELLARLDDLRASRMRLVTAQDEERRKLERNLHDGAQQNLIALKVKLGLLKGIVEKDPAKARELVGQLTIDADEALQTLRDLARGIYPPLLADKGLAAALEGQARKASLPVTVEADGVERYPREVEAAVYFCALEALQNVQKYAGARKAIVRLRADDHSLGFEIEDDGKGFDPETVKRGSGLTNIADRVDALGGSLDIYSSSGGGARLAGSIPLPMTSD